MSQGILSRYLNAEVLSRVADRPLEPRSLVIGNLAGAHKSPLSGFAVEFAGHREYVPGDDPRHIDWRVYFNRDKYFVKQYELETNFVCHLLLDVSASMRYGKGLRQKLLYASQMAATLGYSIVRQSDKVSLSTFDDRLRGFVAPSNSMDQLLRMTQHLDESQGDERTRAPEQTEGSLAGSGSDPPFDIGRCLSELTSRTGRREIVMIFSDFFANLDSIEAAIERMRYSRHEVVLFQVLHHDELTFPFESMTKFVGLEIPEDLLARPEDLRSGYLQALERFNRRLDDIATRNGCEHILVDTSRPMVEVFVDYLNQRSALNRGR